MSNIKIFTSEKCPPCQVAKEQLEEEGIDFREIDIDEPRGKEKANEKNINYVPTAIVNGEKIQGMWNKEEYLKKIREAKR